MNRKGLSLIELLAVIVILAIILILALPAFERILDRTRGTTNRISTKNLQEAAKDFGNQILLCQRIMIPGPGDELIIDPFVVIVRDVLGNPDANCNDFRNAIRSGGGITFPLRVLKENNFFDDPRDVCKPIDGMIMIRVEEPTRGHQTERIEVDLGNVRCIN